MAVQQRRVSKSRKNMRRSHHALKTPNLATCTKCGSPTEQHTVCRSCGFYKGKKIITVK